MIKPNPTTNTLALDSVETHDNFDSAVVDFTKDNTINDWCNYHCYAIDNDETDS